MAAQKPPPFGRLSMPRAENPANTLVDTWGRRNRVLNDRKCAACSADFRPLRSASRYCSRKCAWSQNGGRNKKPETWWTCKKGYVVGRVWEDGRQRHVKYHRVAMERHLGRRLLPDEDVHHVDGNKKNNNLDNLMLISHGAHSSLSNRNRALLARIRGETQ